MRTIYHAALAGALFTAAQGATVHAQAFVQGPASAVEQYRLSNGMTVLLAQDRTAPAVSFWVWHHTGSEGQEREQLGALLSPVHPSLRTAAVERVTDVVVVPRDQLGTAMRLKAGQVQGLISSSNNMALSASDVTAGAAPADLVSAAALEDVGKFFQEYYALSNATITVTGNFDRAATKALIEKYFGSLSPAPESARVRGGLTFTVVTGRGTESSEATLRLIQVGSL